MSFPRLSLTLLWALTYEGRSSLDVHPPRRSEGQVSPARAPC